MSKITTFLSLCCIALVFSCQRLNVEPVGISASIEEESITVEEAQQWFEQRKAASQFGNGARLADGKKPKFNKKPLWKQAKTVRTSKGEAVAVRFERDADALAPRIRGAEKVERLTSDDNPLGADELSTMLVYKKGKDVKAEVMTAVPDEGFYKDLKQKKSTKPFTGKLLVTDLEENFVRGLEYVNGKATATLDLNTSPNAGGRVASSQCYVIDWYTQIRIIDWNGSNVTYWIFPPTYNYSQTYCTRIILSGMGGGDIEADHAIAIQAWESNAGQAQYADFEGFNFASFNNTPIVNIYDQVECFLNTSGGQYRYEITFYVDQPGNGGSGSSNITADVGHVFVGFRSISYTNGAVVERTFGFYPLDTKSAINGSSGMIHSNETSPYDVSVTYPVSAQQMAAAAATARSNASNPYILKDFNCTDYAKRIADAAGLWLPVESEALYFSNSGLWISSPGKLGLALRQWANNSPGTISTNSGTGPINRGGCR